MKKVIEKVASFLLSVILIVSLLACSIQTYDRIFLPDKPPVTHKIEEACIYHWAIFILLNGEWVRGSGGGKSPMPKPRKPE